MSLPLPVDPIEAGSPPPSVRPTLRTTPVFRLVSNQTTEPDPSAKDEGEDEDEDAWCISAAKAGDPRAFEALVKRHQGHAMAIALALVKDEQDAGEIVQEAFLRVHRGLPNFQGTSSFFTWLYRIVTNLAIDLMRKPMRRETDHLDAEILERATHLPCFSTLDSDPFDNLCRSELVARMDARVRELPAYHQGVILMREVEGMSYEEMAVEMGVSKGTIMSRLFHARQKLQRSLGEEYEEHLGESHSMSQSPAQSSDPC